MHIDGMVPGAHKIYGRRVVTGIFVVLMYVGHICRTRKERNVLGRERADRVLFPR